MDSFRIQKDAAKIFSTAASDYHNSTLFSMRQDAGKQRAAVERVSKHELMTIAACKHVQEVCADDEVFEFFSVVAIGAVITNVLSSLFKQKSYAKCVDLITPRVREQIEVGKMQLTAGCDIIARTLESIPPNDTIVSECVNDALFFQMGNAYNTIATRVARHISGKDDAMAKGWNTSGLDASLSNIKLSQELRDTKEQLVSLKADINDLEVRLQKSERERERMHRQRDEAITYRDRYKEEMEYMAQQQSETATDKEYIEAMAQECTRLEKENAQMQNELRLLRQIAAEQNKKMNEYAEQRILQGVEKEAGTNKSRGERKTKGKGEGEVAETVGGGKGRSRAPRKAQSPTAQELLQDAGGKKRPSARRKSKEED